MQNEFAIAAHWSGEFDEDQFQTWCESLRAKLQAPSVSLGLVFASSRYFDLAEQVLEIVRVHARVPLLAGCSSDSLIANGREIEDNAGIVVALYHLPGAELKAVRFTADQLADANGPAYWHSTSGVAPSETNGWLAFADPFHLDCEAWLRSWSESYRHRPIVGGLASGNHEDRRTQIYLDGEVFEPLRDVTRFASAHLNSDIDTVVWDNGADMSPDFLYEMSVPVDDAPLMMVAEEQAPYKTRNDPE